MPRVVPSQVAAFAVTRAPGGTKGTTLPGSGSNPERCDLCRRLPVALQELSL